MGIHLWRSPNIMIIMLLVIFHHIFGETQYFYMEVIYFVGTLW
jgi:hypothetical protein